MATQLSVVNNILGRLREKRVTSTQDTPYAMLIAQLVAEAYEEVSDEWNWASCFAETYVRVPAGTVSLVIDGTSVTRGAVPTWESILHREEGFSSAYTFLKSANDPAIEVESGVPLSEATLPRLLAQRAVAGDGTTSRPSLFAFWKRPYDEESGESLLLELLEPATQDLTFCMQYYLRPVDLESDGTTDSTHLELPKRPVQELAMMYALNERGEEMGEAGNLAENRYIKALAAAKEADILASEHSNASDWRRD